MKGTVAACKLDPNMTARLTRFARATGSFKTRIIRAALDEFIEKYLRENDGVRERFDRYTIEDEARAMKLHRHLKVIK